MSAREPLIDATFFNNETRYVENIIIERLNKLRTQSATLKKPELILYSNARDYLELIFLDYSAGRNIAEIQQRLEPAVNALADYLQSPSAKIFDFKNIDDYIWALRLASFSVLFDASPELATKIPTLFKGNKDALFDRLIASRIPLYPIKKDLCHPKIFLPLLEVFDASPELRIELVSGYLNTWYKNMANAYWHEAHKGPDGGGFVGYWSFESAAVCALTNTETSLLKTKKYFPKDIL